MHNKQPSFILLKNANLQPILMDKILECIPNFSEGADRSALSAIADAITSVPDVWLLHTDRSPAAGRTVFTFAGRPEAVIEAAFKAIAVAAQCIDMRRQHGVHPRIGATDVCPLVPLQDMSMEEADEWAQVLARRVGAELQIPVFCYEHSQQRGYRKYLPQIRKGQYEGMKAKMQLPEWQPDYGPALMNERTGATVIGARRILVAFNISLDTDDVSVAMDIADQMRTAAGTSDALPRLRAIGWYMADYGQAQVSFNLLDYKVTSPVQVWERCGELAARCHIALVGSELIGLMPEQCLLEAGRKAAAGRVPKDLLQEGIAYLGLNRLKAFAPEEKILEYVLKAHSGRTITLA